MYWNGKMKSKTTYRVYFLVLQFWKQITNECLKISLLILICPQIGHSWKSSSGWICVDTLHCMDRLNIPSISSSLPSSFFSVLRFSLIYSTNIWHLLHATKLTPEKAKGVRHSICLQGTYSQLQSVGECTCHSVNGCFHDTRSKRRHKKGAVKWEKQSS